MERTLSWQLPRVWQASLGATLLVFLLALPPVAAVGSPVPGEFPGYYLIEIDGRDVATFITMVLREGAHVLSYLPPNSYVVRTTPHVESLLKNAVGVRSINLYPTILKIDSKLETAVGPISVLVLPFADQAVSVPSVAEAIARLGGKVTSVTPENYRILATIDASVLAQIASIPEVQWIQSQGTPSHDMDNVRAYTGADYVHAQNYDGTGVVGEVMDDGIDQGHPEFASRLLATDCPGACPIANHGTSTFAIAFARGVDPRAEGMLSGTHTGPPSANGVFALDTATSGFSRTLAAKHLVENWGGVFQSNSWGQGTNNQAYDAYSAEIDQIVFDRDITMTQSMGNYFIGDPNHARSDAMSKDIIAIGGLYHQNNQDRTDDYWGSGFTGGVGPASDGRIKPDLSGPMDLVYTACGFFDPARPNDCPGTHAYREDFSGTSAAAPVVGGAAGLVYHMYKANAFGNNPSGANPHASTVKALLIANAYQFNLATQAKRCEQGWGTPDLKFMYDRRLTHQIIDGTILMTQGMVLNSLYTSHSTAPLKITLAWTDPPASPPYASPHLVNDLDLMVIDPQGHFYWGNYGLTGDTSQPRCPGASQWSVSGSPLMYGERDAKNNVENVFVQSPAWGVWSISVRAHYIVQDGYPQTPNVVDQPYSLVISAGPTITDVQPPAQTTLQLPSCGSGVDERPGFSWTAFNDPSPSSGLRWYNFELATDPTFVPSSIVVRARPRDNLYASPHLAPGIYYWRVKAEDNAGNLAASWSSPAVCDLTVVAAGISPPGGLTVSRVEPSTVRLSWNAVTGADHYRVYENPNRYPALPAWSLLTETTVLTYDVPGQLSDGLTHYYIVRAVQGSSVSGASTMGVKVGLTVGYDPPGTNVHYFSVPYRSEFTKASDISNYLTSAKIELVEKWNPSTQSASVWDYFRGAWRGDDFTIYPGDGLWLGSVAAFSWPIVGTDQSSTLSFVHNLDPYWHWVGLPYATTVARASDIVYALEGGLGPGTNAKVVEISKWYSGEHLLAIYQSSPTGWTGTDFEIFPGEAVRIKTASPYTWQPPLVTPEVP